MTIDVNFDLHSDTPAWKDPDTHGPTLKRYHRALWSKPLPSGAPFELEIDGVYLAHESALGSFRFSGDHLVTPLGPTCRAVNARTGSDELPNRVRYTIGASLIFPAQRVDGKMTINGARGFLATIKDRVDLTLECIRRHYSNETSPMSAVMARYANFFALFESFEGYVDFFHLDDLVAGPARVRFFLPFDGFTSRPIPTEIEQMREFALAMLAFVEARNQRIDRVVRERRPSVEA